MTLQAPTPLGTHHAASNIVSAQVPSPSFPFHVWGTVPPSPHAGPITALKVEPSPSGGYLLLTREGPSEFDTWLEHLEEVEAEVAALRVEWPSEA